MDRKAIIPLAALLLVGCETDKPLAVLDCTDDTGTHYTATPASRSVFGCGWSVKDDDGFELSQTREPAGWRCKLRTPGHSPDCIGF